VLVAHAHALAADSLVPRFGLVEGAAQLEKQALTG
jgi:hypothetical protein